MMEKDIERLVKIAEESLKIQKEILDFTKGMHKLTREMNLRIIDKLANL